VFVPEMNTILFLAVVVTVVGFRSSNALGGAYGVAVTGTMLVDTILGFTYLALGARWPIWLLVPLFSIFAIVDMLFFSANLLKVVEGGWFPIIAATFAFTVMGTWWRWQTVDCPYPCARCTAALLVPSRSQPLSLMRVSGTAIFMTRDLSQVPVVLLHALKHYKTLHERVILMHGQNRRHPACARRAAP